MYEELKKELRNKYRAYIATDNEKPGRLFREAADAIEELQAAVSWYEMTTDVEFVKENGHERIRFVPKWIPVTERLPNIEDDVLIYGEWTGASGTKCREVWLTDFKEFLHQRYKPIAWMPLPEPPKEEK